MPLPNDKHSNNNSTDTASRKKAYSSTFANPRKHKIQLQKKTPTTTTTTITTAIATESPIAPVIDAVNIRLESLQDNIANIQQTCTPTSPRSVALTNRIRHSKYTPLLMGILETHQKKYQDPPEILQPCAFDQVISANAGSSNDTIVLSTLRKTEQMASTTLETMFESMTTEFPMEDSRRKQAIQTVIKKFRTAEEFLVTNLNEQQQQQQQQPTKITTKKSKSKGPVQKQGTLPESAVKILHKWLLQNFSYPYPTDEEREQLAKEAGVEVRQVVNWFGNARVRLWKPVMEAMTEKQ